MSVSLSWKPTDPKSGTSFGGGSSLHSAMERAFGGFPMTLTLEHIPKLEGIAACGYDDVHELIIAIHTHDSVDVEAQW
jgi:hypothetical protein